MFFEFIIRLKKKEKMMEPAAEPPLMNPTLCSPESSEHTQQDVWLLRFSGELGGTGRTWEEPGEPNSCH